MFENSGHAQKQKLWSPRKISELFQVLCQFFLILCSQIRVIKSHFLWIIQEAAQQGKFSVSEKLSIPASPSPRTRKAVMQKKSLPDSKQNIVCKLLLRKKFVKKFLITSLPHENKYTGLELIKNLTKKKNSTVTTLKITLAKLRTFPLKMPPWGNLPDLIVNSTILIYNRMKLKHPSSLRLSEIQHTKHFQRISLLTESQIIFLL